MHILGTSHTMRDIKDDGCSSCRKPGGTGMAPCPTNTTSCISFEESTCNQALTGTRGYSTTRFSNHYSYPTRKILLLDRVVE